MNYEAAKYIKYFGLFFIFIALTTTLLKAPFGQKNPKAKQDVQQSQGQSDIGTMQTQQAAMANYSEQPNTITQQDYQYQDSNYSAEYAYNPPPEQQYTQEDVQTYKEQKKEETYKESDDKSYSQYAFPEVKKPRDQKEEQEEIDPEKELINQYNRTKSKSDFMALARYYLDRKQKDKLKPFYQNYTSIHDDEDYEIDMMKSLF